MCVTDNFLFIRLFVYDQYVRQLLLLLFLALFVMKLTPNRTNMPEQTAMAIIIIK